jgi:hypothetical protein
MQVEVGYLVTLHLFPGDDLPQRWFSRREDAFDYARKVRVDELVSTFDYCVDGREIESQPLSITEFRDGIPDSVTMIGRADFPEVMGDKTPCLSTRDGVTV